MVGDGVENVCIGAGCVVKSGCVDQADYAGLVVLGRVAGYVDGACELRSVFCDVMVKFDDGLVWWAYSMSNHAPRRLLGVAGRSTAI